MNDNRLKVRLGVEELGSRVLPSASPATIQADITKVRADVQKLQADAVTILPTLIQDQHAIRTAINSSAAVQAARATLTSDITTWISTYRADVQAIISAPDATTRAADYTKLFTDWTNAVKTLQADQKAVQTAIDNDPAVQAARAKLMADNAPLAADEAAIQADWQQLQKDLHS
jgi:hypothetical protein